MKLDNLVDHHELSDELQSLDDFLSELQKDEEAAPVKTPEPRVHWRKRDIDGNIVYARPRSSRNQSNKVLNSELMPFQAGNKGVVPLALGQVEDVLITIRKLNLPSMLLTLTVSRPLLQRLLSLFREVEGREIPSGEHENGATHICQQCGSNPAAVRCCDCQPCPFFCTECDVSMHTRHVLHNRDAMTAGFYQPLPPTTFVVDKALSHCVRLVPVGIPDKICGCSPESLRASPVKTVAAITINGQYDLSMPELSCEACQATWAAGVVGLNRNALLVIIVNLLVLWVKKQFDANTGKISIDSFQKMFFEWETVRYELDKICKEKPFICPACTPDMLAVSVDGNRKHYHFKNAVRSEEQAIFEDIFIAKDEDVTRSVDYIHKTFKHVSGRGVCGGEWSAARETSQGSASQVDEEGLELAGETAWPWQLPHSDSVDLRMKRKAFDIIMSVRRLREEQKILVAEIDHHWKYLSTRAETLRELSCVFASETLQNSHCGLSEEGLKGLQSIIHKNQHKIRDMRVQARDCYLQVLSGPTS
ncbi:hypothetical protein H4Q32_022624 [Labeo rohita]|uniref:CxC3 like cysteine cluster domain-containing protein n=1 Tax=Labeo rohita TaxID=84645 RepID=A0ABQ8MBN6_LABRO|nr:hypothetical protein H4Q32_022624 [Labeo rohita]